MAVAPVSPEPDRILSKGELLGMFRLMLLSRALSERVFNLQRQGRIGTVAGATGQEAAIVGSVWALDRSRDWIVPQYRELAALVHQGVPLAQVLLYFMGHPAARPYADDVKAMPLQIALTAQLPHAVGLGWGLHHQGKDAVVLTYFGEGAASEGDFHEALNLAGVRNAPVIFMLQNNGWAISTPARLQTAAPSLAARAAGYGIAGEQVDGNDVLAVFDATSRAVTRARSGSGPTLIEALTYRTGPHNTSDDEKRYMDPTELGLWESRDPLDSMRTQLQRKGHITEADEAQMREQLAAELATAVQEAEALSDPRAEALFEHVYASPPPRMARQWQSARGGETS